ncbi:hypothetical protein BJ912DRAFT_1025004 [Pholiota molesta]|nr:hypothetical protein BJ912DRAFT_1025004 [Pholiota molesta]
MSFSVPTSPAMSRSAKAQPVTPQRLPRHQPRSQSFYRSPLTPSTSPYTPMSLRSFDSTGSSILTTPDNLNINVKKRLAFSGVSPDVVRTTAASQDKSIADIADNWRSRANENGIKVAFEPQDDSNYIADDSSDMSLSDVANDSVIISEDSLLAAPSFSTHRRLHSLPISNRPRAQSHASAPRSRVHPSSPVIPRLPNSLNLMSTPPPNRTLARQLKLKGSLTDPAQPRRREAFGTVSTTHNVGQRNASMNLALEPDTSLDLFDIDENDFEYENEFQDSEIQNSFSRNLQALQAHSFGYPTFAPRYQQEQLDAFIQPTFADPFQHNALTSGLLNGRILNGIAESVEHHFQATRQPPLQKPFYDELHQNGHVFYPSVPRLPQYNQGIPHAYPAPQFIPVPQPPVMSFQPPISMHAKAPADRSFSSPASKSYTQPLAPELNPTDCSVCLASHPTTLAILQPCRHPLCSACLTSALNIVGEKDMECAVCKQSVEDFKLIMGSSKGGKTGADTSALASEMHSTTVDGVENVASDLSDVVGKSSMDAHSLLASRMPSTMTCFEFGLFLGDLRASTPKLEQQMQEQSNGWSQGRSSQRDLRNGEDNVVLRIDNVPWDITPLQITKWLQQPVERVHVLLDGKGKTLSHAYVEVRDAATAGAILRGEALSSSGKKERGSLFPRWRGTFDGSRPSLAGVEGDRVIGALEGGLLTEHEISGLLYLIREPDSHFLKVPILSKFPTDADSRLFWSANVRDMLFGEGNAKSSSRQQEEEYTIDLAVDILHTALDCKAFTVQQIQALIDLAQACSLPLPEHDQSHISDSSSLSGDNSGLRTPSSQDSSTIVFKQHNLAEDRSLEKIAKEFGIDAHVMQALAQRLANLS